MNRLIRQASGERQMPSIGRPTGAAATTARS